MPFKILAHFVGDRGVLRNIIMLPTEPDNSCQSHIIEWQWIQFGRNPVLLTWLDSKGPIMTFSEGTLVADNDQGTFTYRDTTHHLTRTR